MTEQLAITPALLLRTIHELDLGIDANSGYDAAEIEYLVVTRWHGDGQGGHEDDDVGLLFRALLREKLGGYTTQEIGAAVLEEIDSRV